MRDRDKNFSHGWELVLSLVKVAPDSHGEMVRWMRQTTLESPWLVSGFSIWEKIILALGADAEPLVPTLEEIRLEARNPGHIKELIATIEKAAAEKKAQNKS